MASIEGNTCDFGGFCGFVREATSLSIYFQSRRRIISNRTNRSEGISRAVNYLQQKAAAAPVEVILPEVENVTEDDVCADHVQKMLCPVHQTGSNVAVARKMLNCCPSHDSRSSALESWKDMPAQHSR
jgi:hypothetical protein